MLPALGHRELEFQLGVVEHAAFHESLTRVVAVGQALNQAQVAVAVHGEGAAALLLPGLGRQLLHGAVAVGGVGVSAQERGGAARAAGLLLALEGEEEIGHVRGIVPDFAGIGHAQFVGLPFIVAAVLEEYQPHALGKRLGQRGHPLRQNRAQQQGPGGQRGARLLLVAVPGRNVAQLVAQHARELGLIIKMSHDAAREIHVTVGGGKGINHRRIEDGELVAVVGAAGNGGHLLALQVDKFLEGRVVEQAELGQHLRVGLLGLGQRAKSSGTGQRQQQGQRAEAQGAGQENFHTEED